MKVLNEPISEISIRLFGNPPNVRIFAELTETELRFIQDWRDEIAFAPHNAEIRRELIRARRDAAAIQKHNKKIGYKPNDRPHRRR
ncbi:MAG: hypothetical protein PHQ75_09480 [Thermoguttaceae bacterium]|nr:hypothetical protein [Thermoguttaceae bacterium]